MSLHARFSLSVRFPSSAPTLFVFGIWLGILTVLGTSPLMASGRTTPADLVGQWQGELQAPDGETEPLVLNLDLDDEGQLTGTADLPDRGEKGLTLIRLSIALEMLDAEVADSDRSFEAFIEGDRTQLRGFWSSDGQSYSLRMQKLDADGNPIPPPSRAEKAPVETPAPDESGVTGRWQGEISRPDGEPIALFVDFGRDATGSWIAELDMDFQLLENLPLDRVEIDAPSVRFVAVGLRDDPVFDGRIDAAKSVIEGTFEAGEVRFPFRLERIGGAELEEREPPLPLPNRVVEEWVGRWEGLLGVEGSRNSERIGLDLVRVARGGLIGTVDLPDRGLKRLPIVGLIAWSDDIRVELPVSETHFEGFRGEDRTLLRGTWSIAGIERPFQMRKVD